MMDPKITITSEENNNLYFTLSNIPTCLANSLRRIILSEIPITVFRTFPHAESKVNIITNTSRFNNEIIKQRIGCIPIHISDSEFPINEYSVELNIMNNTDNIITVTTKDLKIKNKVTDKYISETETRNIFPADSITNDFITLCRLRPKLSENLDGEHLQFIADLDIGTAKEDGMYNIVSTCSYGATNDTVKANDAWNDINKVHQSNGLSEEEIQFEKDNWFLLEAKRYTIPNSFDFVIESVGVFTNIEIVKRGCDIMIKKCKDFIDNLKTTSDASKSTINNNINEYIKNLNHDKSILIEKNENSTVDNEFLVTLQNEDYTLGNAIVYFLYEDYFVKKNDVSFVGFRVPHPHIPNGIIRIAFNSPETDSTVISYLETSTEQVIEVYEKILKLLN